MNLLNKIVHPFAPEKAGIDSSFIKEAEYSRRTRKLTLKFKNGTIYSYGSVEPQLYRRFKSAESKGRFFHKEIRGTYPFIKD